VKEKVIQRGQANFAGGRTFVEERAKKMGSSAQSTKDQVTPVVAMGGGNKKGLAQTMREKDRKKKKRGQLARGGVWTEGGRPPVAKKKYNMVQAKYRKGGRQSGRRTKGA